MYYMWLSMIVRFLLIDSLVDGLDSNSTKKDAISMRMTSLLSPRSNSSWSGRSTTEKDTVLPPGIPWKNEEFCGKTDKSLSGFIPRIVGGSATVRGEWPWMAMILRYYVMFDKFSFVCGGSLILKQWVLTAGHCFSNEPAEYTHVVLGAHRKDMKDKSVRRFAVAKYICHHSFIGPSNAYEDDICLIKLAGETEYNEYIKPICLPTGGQAIKSGEACRIAGWGETEGTGDNGLLQKAEVHIIKKAICDLWYAEAGVTLPEHHFCAGYEGGTIDSCQGDSGGPLTCTRTTSEITANVLFGITSFGIGCAQKQRPGVYTQVSKYIGWLESLITKYSGDEYCFSKLDIHNCGSTIIKSGTKLRTAVDSFETWLYPANSVYIGLYALIFILTDYRAIDSVSDLVLQDCAWYINAPIGCRIQLTFECFFHVEINSGNADECYDYMGIFSEEADIDSIYCGSDLLQPVTINSTKATISFHSDSSLQSSGFVIRVNFVKIPVVIGEPKLGQPFTINPDNETRTSPVTTKHVNTEASSEENCDCTTPSASFIIKSSFLPILGALLLILKLVQ